MEEAKNIEPKTIASVYGSDDILYFLRDDKCIYYTDKEGNAVKVTDKNKISEILSLFKPGRTDVIVDNEREI